MKQSSRCIFYNCKNRPFGKAKYSAWVKFEDYCFKHLVYWAEWENKHKSKGFNFRFLFKSKEDEEKFKLYYLLKGENL